jgi:hypothetical protein
MNGKHQDFINHRPEVDVLGESSHQQSSHRPIHAREPGRILLDPIHRCSDGFGKGLLQSQRPPVPVDLDAASLLRP